MADDVVHALNHQFPEGGFALDSRDFGFLEEVFGKIDGCLHQSNIYSKLARNQTKPMEQGMRGWLVAMYSFPLSTAL